MQKTIELDHYGVDNSPVDNTEIVSQNLLYYSKQEADEFKALCKTGIVDLFGKDAIAKGNISDFILKLLRKHYGNGKQSTPYTGEVYFKQEDDRPAGGGFEDDVPPV